MKQWCWRCALVVTAVLTGCHAPQEISDIPSIWGPGPIRNPEDAQRLVAEALDQTTVVAPELPDPRDWSWMAEDWQLSLHEALAIAMTNSPVVRVLPATQNPAGPFSSPTNRVSTVFDPTIESTRVEAELGRFDARLETSFLGNPVEFPPNTSLNGSTRRPTAQDRATFSTSLGKPLATGGEARIDFRTNYRFVPSSTLSVNPQYQPEFGLELRQPLLRGAGKEVNLSPVVIVAAEAQQSAWNLHNDVLGMARSIESGYWALYSAHTNVRTIDRLLPLLHEVVRLAEAHVRADLAIPADAAQARTQLLDFERQRLDAIAVVRNEEDLLRQLLGLPPDSSHRIVPSIPADPELPGIDWNETVSTALWQRPDIMRQRLAIYIAQRVLRIAENEVLPSVDALAAWRVKGLGEDVGEALDLLGDVRFNDWALGLAFSVPLGNHTSRANRRAAQLVLNREHALLQETIHEAGHQLSRLVYDLELLFQQHSVALKQRAAILEWLQGARARYLTPTNDVSLTRSLDLYLEAIRVAADVEREIADLKVRYHSTFARLKEEEGTLLAERGIYLYQDPCLGVRRILGPRRLPAPDDAELPLMEPLPAPVDFDTRPGR